MDGLSTLLVAGMQSELADALNYAVSIDFTSPDGLVDPFETIIRYRNLVLHADQIPWRVGLDDRFTRRGLRGGLF